MKISGAAVTNTGGTRLANEDCVMAGSWKEQRSMIVPYAFQFSDPRGDVVLVADGMGGHRAGERASHMAVNAFLVNNQSLTNPVSLAVFLRGINRSIFDASAEEIQLRGMGTTIAGVVCSAEALLWFNVGDSRVYRLRDEFLRQLSVDDVAPRAVIREAPKVGLTQSLGGTMQFVDIEPHIGMEPLADGWRYLICSDGLTDILPVSAIEEMISDSDEATVQMLLDTTLARGAPDNVSIIMMTVKTDTEDEWGQLR